MISMEIGNQSSDPSKYSFPLLFSISSWPSTSRSTEHRKIQTKCLELMSSSLLTNMPPFPNVSRALFYIPTEGQSHNSDWSQIQIEKHTHKQSQHTQPTCPRTSTGLRGSNRCLNTLDPARGSARVLLPVWLERHCQWARAFNVRLWAPAVATEGMFRIMKTFIMTYILLDLFACTTNLSPLEHLLLSLLFMFILLQENWSLAQEALSWEY